MNTTSSAIAGVIDNLKAHVKQLESEIREDLKGRKDYEKQLYLIDKQRAELQARIDKGQQWCDEFDANILPFQRRYESLNTDISDLYTDAKGEHAKAIQLLEREFNYNRMYKKPGAEFSGVPFVPK